MLKKQFVPMALSALLLVSPLAMAQEAHQAHHPEEGAVTGKESTTASGEMPTSSGGMMGGSGMMGQGMMGSQQEAENPPAGSSMGSGMMMGRRGMMGMMHGGKGEGMMGCGGHGKGRGHGKQEKNQELIGRLDLLEARLAKIETMLERLLQR